MPLNSRTEAFLSGKPYPGANGGKVKTVVKKGNLRIITLNNGQVIRTNKQGLMTSFHRVLTAHQAIGAKKSVRTNPDGTTSVTIGGAEKGERRTYDTLALAKSAITRAYGRPGPK